MPITHRVGNLFDSTDVQAIAHGVNCCGVMGAGIAVEFKRRYPLMFREYRKVCFAPIVNDDDIGMPWGTTFDWLDETNNLVVFNLFTQPNINGRIGLASPESIYLCFHTMLNLALVKYPHVTDIGIPRIGAGLGGLEWDEVEEQVNQALAATQSPINIIVHSLV